MRVEIKDLISFEDLSEETGHAASKLRTWFSRNTNGLTDLCDRADFRPPLFRLTKMEKWIVDNMAEGHIRPKRGS